MKKVVTLGTFSVIYNNWLPYAAGCLISYCKGIKEINDTYEFREPLFIQKPVEDYKEILLSTDILGLTCYVWNQNYNDLLAQYYKSIKPNGIVLYGGPQVPEDTSLKKEYDSKLWIDKSIAGLGEIAFSEYLLNLPYSNSTLKEIPIPYLDGTFDSILTSSEKIKVSFETNRGCPYGCTFCDWGGQARSKIIKFDEQKIYQTIDKIYQYNNIDELEILDANFGIFTRDVDFIDFMIECQNKYNNHLRISYSGLAKNGSKNLLVIIEKVFNNLPIDQRNLKLSFQTHTASVLKILHRDNIKNDKLIPLIQEFKDKNVPTTSEMIIALPGETAESWLKTLHYNYHNLKIDYVRTYILHVVPNTPLYDLDYRKQYNIRIKTIEYNSNTVEIINSCFSYDLEELKLMFSYFWFFNTFVNTDILKTQIKDLYAETKDFISNIDKFPILSRLLNDYICIVEKIFSRENVTALEKDEIRFFTSTLRWKELEEIITNIDAQKELESIYGPIDIKWECDNPRLAISTVC